MGGGGGVGDSCSMKFVILYFPSSVVFRALKLWKMRWARKYARKYAIRYARKYARRIENHNLTYKH
jgi:hypothetical protein